MAILVGVGCLPSRAAAECGDYVHIAKQTPANAEQSAPMPKPPCDGPNCSQRPATPVLPVSVPISEVEVSKQFTQALASDLHASDVRGFYFVQVQLSLPDPIPTSIFHPPRSI